MSDQRKFGEFSDSCFRLAGWLVFEVGNRLETCDQDTLFWLDEVDSFCWNAASSLLAYPR